MAGSLNLGKVRGQGVISGGTTGQALVKKSGTDYDTEWRNVPQSVNQVRPDTSGNITVNTGVMTINGVAPSNGNSVVDTGVMTVNGISPVNGNVDVDAGISNVSYDTTNKKLTKAMGSQTIDIVTTDRLKTDMNLSNVDNTADANKPISTAVQNALDTKSDKTATVSSVAYANKKLTKTVNNTTSDVVSISDIKTDLELSKSDVGLSNVDNTSDIDKPVSIATQTALDAKANKNATVSTVSYGNNKFTKTINGATTDIVAVSALKTDMDLNKVENKTASEIISEIEIISDEDIDALFDE